MTDQLQAPVLPQAPRNPSGHAPLRRAHSMRRTSSIDVTWPDGPGEPMRFHGQARDLHTLQDGSAHELRGDSVLAELAADRTIRAIAAVPPRPAIGRLVGCKGGGYLRQEIDAVLPAEREAGTPLYLLLDDLSGTSLIARWAWSHWSNDWLRKEFAGADEAQLVAARRDRMENICTGFRTGSSALSAAVSVTDHSQSHVVPLSNPADPAGWHAMTEQTSVSLRRARRIDVWLDGVVHIDAMFQDSATLPAGGRAAIHEYTLRATADPQAMTLLSITPEPRILPWPECPSAIANVARLIGTPLHELRQAVLRELKRELGCTHLNDALRALAEVPVLVNDLREAAAVG